MAVYRLDDDDPYAFPPAEEAEEMHRSEAEGTWPQATAKRLADADRRVLSEPILVSLGDPTTTVVQPGEVFAAALKLDAKAIVLAHNHPSGDPSPSIQDRALTAVISRLGGELNIRLVDHLVVGGLDVKSARED